MDKVRLLRIDPVVVLDLLKIPSEGVTRNGVLIKPIGDQLPDTAKVVSWYFYTGNDDSDIVLKISDESFTPVLQLDRIPTLNLAFSVTR